MNKLDGQERANQFKEKIAKLTPGGMRKLSAFINFLIFLDKHPLLARIIKRPGTWIFYHV